MSPRTDTAFKFFEVVGMELEYVIVDDDLKPLCILEDAFSYVHGRPTSDIEYDSVGFSNELAAHVFEIKNVQPQRSLIKAEDQLLAGLKFFAGVLDDRFGARLLPTGMHPFMRPADTKLWQRASRAIYETYASIFSIHQHGWLNVQASHINLPFGSETDAVLLHNATACLLPYLPALAASSPIYEGKLGPSVDNRLEFYKLNQRRIPAITGEVVPKFIGSFRDYRRDVFKPIRASLDGLPGTKRLQPEWVNSRGAIMRFSRRALEIKILDVQECIRSDIAIAVFTVAALKYLVQRLRNGSLTLPDYRMLVADLDAVIRDGSRAAVQALHLRPAALARSNSTNVRSVLGQLLEGARSHIKKAEERYLPIIEDKIEHGNLSERIAAGVQKRVRRSSVSEHTAIRDIYEELVSCLQRNTIWAR